jgi:hypothetical protein
VISASTLADLKKWRFWRHFLIHSFAALGAAAVVVQLVDSLVVKGEDALRGNVPLASIVAAVAAIYGLSRAWPRPIEQVYAAPRVKVSVVEGDLFDQPDCHLVIGAPDTFDTKTPHIISPTSVQGQFQARVYNGDLDTLNLDLESALKSKSVISTIQKGGKTKKYEIGTVAVLRDHTRCYFWLAYTEMSPNNQAQGSVDGLWRSLDSLWRSVNAHANGGSVAIPVIGGGLSRVSQILPAQDAIRLSILSYMWFSRSTKVCDELKVVVRPEDFRSLDRLELQSFLKSLRAS